MLYLYIWFAVTLVFCEILIILYEVRKLQNCKRKIGVSVLTRVGVGRLTIAHQRRNSVNLLPTRYPMTVLQLYRWMSTACGTTIWKEMTQSTSWEGMVGITVCGSVKSAGWTSESKGQNRVQIWYGVRENRRISQFGVTFGKVCE